MFDTYYLYDQIIKTRASTHVENSTTKRTQGIITIVSQFTD